MTKKRRVVSYSSPFANLLVPESELSDTAIFEPPLVDLFLGPSEWLGRLIVCCDERIDVPLQLLDGGEGCAVQRLALEN